MRSTRRVLCVPVLLLALLAGCGQDQDATGRPGGALPGIDVPASADHNAADAQFATVMIPHHAQALTLVDLTRGRHGLSRDVLALAEQIRSARAPEIEEMTGWLKDWDLPVPATGRDHVHGGGHGSSGAPMEEGAHLDGLITAEQLAELEQAPDARFEGLWLETMIEHHRGALDRAETEVRDGELAETRDLARRILDSQRAEIDRMERMLESR